jgi:hypothetical protein
VRECSIPERSLDLGVSERMRLSVDAGAAGIDDHDPDPVEEGYLTFVDEIVDVGQGASAHVEVLRV